MKFNSEEEMLLGQNTGSGTVPITGGLASMTYLGVTSNGHEYPNPSVPNSTWRKDGNQNPNNMFDIIRSLFDDNVLFVIERDINRNVVVYKLNVRPDGSVDPANPIEVFWLMIPVAAPTGPESDDDSGDDEDEDEDEVDLGDVYTEDLTQMERTLAYGVQTEVRNGNRVMFVKALRGEPITVKRTETGWKGCMTIAGVEMSIERILISTEPRAWGLWPTITEAHMHMRENNGRLNVYHYHT